MLFHDIMVSKEACMAKKKANLMGYLYLVGMALVVIGFFCPVFKGALAEFNGWDFLNFKNFDFVTVGGLLILIGAVVGIVLSFVKSKKEKMLKLVAILVSIAGGIVLIIGFNDNVVYKMIAEAFMKYANVGFYMIVVGWVVALVGHFTSK